MGIQSVAVYSECDRSARHVRMADEAYPIGPNPPADSYLRGDRLIDVARNCGADGVHPGYGFLAENQSFAAACRDAGIIFIGPTPELIEKMGSKTAARRAAIAAGAPVVPGTEEALGTDISDEAVASLAGSVGYPLMVKAVAGGGGKGMRVVGSPAELSSAIRAARSEAAASFGDASIFLERQIGRARHIEVQLLGDQHGTVLPFVERECSLQRRHQKVIEETPSAAVSSGLRARLTSAAASVARGVGYTNAGTIEFLVDETGAFYFLEMNTRLQVEHGVTEAVTGIDLVQAQFTIARGAPLDIDPVRALTPIGHAIECRVYAEDPDASFLPSPGWIHELRAPSGPGVRDDSGAMAGSEVPVFYDSLISKVVVWGTDRAQALARMRRAVDEYEIHGVKTTIPFFRWLLRSEAFASGPVDTTFIDATLAARGGRPFVESSPEAEELAVIGAALYAFLEAGHGDASSSASVSAWRQAARTDSLRA